MDEKVEMNRLAAFLANYHLSPEALEDIRNKVSQAGCGFDDPMAIQIAVPEITYYYNYAHLRILQTLTLEIVLKVIDAVRSEMATGGRPCSGTTRVWHVGLRLKRSVTSRRSWAGSSGACCGPTLHGSRLV